MSPRRLDGSSGIAAAGSWPRATIRLAASTNSTRGVNRRASASAMTAYARMITRSPGWTSRAAAPLIPMIPLPGGPAIA
ncbi:hypothetical protein FrCorBMG51_06245 [Protofrankia coriariae]|uniref:Uncharacterized protein n=1 Tax=Protofrankia coriariae TaxID=1562887 RepID=A0ABR5F6C9_9ACTN|nr:hypothetical protein FrCorBMG51_06245 [Protofrankia coriariae]